MTTSGSPSSALPKPQTFRSLLQSASDACLADVVEVVLIELMRREVKFSRAAFGAVHELCRRHVIRSAGGGHESAS